jgi:hypothetical protein
MLQTIARRTVLSTVGVIGAGIGLTASLFLSATLADLHIVSHPAAAAAQTLEVKATDVTVILTNK